MPPAHGGLSLTPADAVPTARSPTASRPALLRHIAGTRALLALSAGLVLLPLLEPRSALALALYLLGAGGLLLLALREHPAAGWRLWLWLDALALLLASRLPSSQTAALAALSVLPVVAMALLSGLGSAVALALACAVGLWVMAAVDAQAAPMALAVPFVLLLLGPAVALLSRPGAALRRRLSLVTELMRQADPRQGLQRQVQVLLGLLGAHFGLSRALLDLPGPEPRVFCWQPEDGLRVLQGPDLAHWRGQRALLPADAGCLSSPGGPVRALDPGDGTPAPLPAPATVRMLRSVGAHGLWLPLHSYGRTQGQLALLRPGTAFAASELRWLHELVHQVLPLLERADLLEQLQHETAARERERIGRDLHDSAVQPYLGLKYGLEAVARMAGPDNPVSPQIAQLVRMTNDELQTLRDMVSGLRQGRDPHEADGALAALLRQAQRFEALFGLKVEVRLPPQPPALRGPLARALLHLFNEALTNVRRHTAATRVTVELELLPDALCMRLRNDRGPGAPLPFTPRSLTERAAEFGGRVQITHPQDCTEVVITLPLDGG